MLASLPGSSVSCRAGRERSRAAAVVARKPRGRLGGGVADVNQGVAYRRIAARERDRRDVDVTTGHARHRHNLPLADASRIIRVLPFRACPKRDRTGSRLKSQTSRRRGRTQAKVVRGLIPVGSRLQSCIMITSPALGADHSMPSRRHSGIASVRMGCICSARKSIASLSSSMGCRFFIGRRPSAFRIFSPCCAAACGW